MSIYINGIGCISPQLSTDGGLFSGDIKMYEGEFLKCIDPDYKLYIPPTMARRAGRIIKMGAAAAKICLQDAGIGMPGAVITGTGMGCIEDTENFLTEIILNDEKMLAPTAFIQSTHNTAAAQIAILLSCNNYNMTYVHRGFSFESALIDSMMQIDQGEAENILAGGLDEMTPGMFAICRRLGVYRSSCMGHSFIFSEKASGSIAGEGAAFFLLDHRQTLSTYCRIEAVEMLYKPKDGLEITGKILKLLSVHSLQLEDIDLVLCGINGDERFDGIYSKVLAPFDKCRLAYYKHLCGEYHTSTAFALWLSAMILKNNRIPPFLLINEDNSMAPGNILIYNHYLGSNHSLILLRKC